MQLLDFQTRWKDLMLDHPDALKTPDTDFAELFVKNRIAIPERLAVYRNNIVGSLTDVMVASHPILEALVGKEFLEYMGRSFVLEHPPATGSLSEYGPGFDAYIRAFEPAQGFPYLGDVAQMEILMNLAYYAKDEDYFTREDLAAIAPEELGEQNFTLADHVRFMRSAYPVDAIRDFALSDQSGDAPDMEAGGVILMVFRKNLDSAIVTIDESFYAAFEALRAGHTLETALEAGFATNPDFPVQDFLHFSLEHETFLRHATK